MDWVSSELVNLLFKFLPGFVAAAVFYGLTAHRKASPFERVIEAMIFTALIQPVIVVLRETLIAAGRVYTIGRWDQDAELVVSVVCALIIGLFFARWINNNSINEWLRSWPWYDKLRQRPMCKWLPEWKWTCMTSNPSEWYSTFSVEQRYVILHIKGITQCRRLYGWPQEWPNQCDKGHFVLCEPTWLLDDGREAPLYGVEKMLVAAADVEMVEFLKDEADIAVELSERQRVQKLLIGEQAKGEDHGSQVSDKAGQLE